MKTLRFTVALAFLFALASCSKNDVESNLTPKQINLTPRAGEVIAMSNNFGINLFAKVAMQEEGNFMLSPLSASVALTMLLNGCNGDTYTQLKQALAYPADLSMGDINAAYKSLVGQLLEADPKVSLVLANAIFYRLGFDVKPLFLQTMASDFDANVQGLNFSHPSALTTINGWASSKTNGKIPKVLDEISSDDVMFLMNALYFKGTWTYPFNKSETSSRPFHLENGSTVNVSTMSGKVVAKHFTSRFYLAIELPYGRTNFSMVLIVPNINFSSFAANFDGTTWNYITHILDSQTGGVSVDIKLPKFKFSFEKMLNSQLQSLGMIDAFIPYVANLTGISNSSIYVSFVKQNTFVEVNEEGTEAAAVTTGGVGITSMPPAFDIDKPFIFGIRERTTNTLMFMGAVKNPTN